MKVGFVGLGKLGLPVALAIESRGFEVFGTDQNSGVKDYLTNRSIPYREKGLQPLLDAHNIGWRDTVAEIVAESNLIFVAVQTPHAAEFEGDAPLPLARADFDYTYLQEAVATIAKECRAQQKHRVVAVISTCLPGTFKAAIEPLLNEFTAYVYTPQFIAMGTVLNDYLNPEFNLVGVHDMDAAELMDDFYEVINDAPTLPTDVITAEGIKVSYNTWITAKTVIANAWGELSERLGMDFNAMHLAWALSDRRLISTRYMRAGMSDGGGCHPRDNIALSWLARESGMSHNIWEDLMLAREDYEAWHCEVLLEAAEELELPIVLLGTAFKPETDITTGSPAMLMANLLRGAGAQFLHVDDLDPLQPAVYFIATQNARYRDYEFPPGSAVIDPFGYIRDQEGVAVRRLGRGRGGWL